MGYNAHGKGYLKLKDGVKLPDELFDLLDQWFDVQDHHNGDVILYFNGKYRQDPTPALNPLMPYIEYGAIEFSDDDDRKTWCAFYDADKDHDWGKIDGIRYYGAGSLFTKAESEYLDQLLDHAADSEMAEQIHHKLHPTPEHPLTSHKLFPN